MAKVLSSISGNLISAASAGFAPTNSGDVSAIASAYQVVSATATQLYAGTAYLTSVNGAPISASRAGNAANASMANSAYYDGTGRLISALPDSAAVSSIASSYAESAVSGKADSSSLSSYALSSDVSGVIDTVSTNSASWGGVDSATVSAIASSYAESAASGKLDSTASSQFITSTVGLATTEYVDSSVSSKLDTTAFSTVSSNFLTSETVTATAGDGTYITSINGMGLSGQGGGGGGVVTATGSASATEGWWPVTTAYLVSSINGSALLPYGYSALSANSSNWNATRTAVTANSANWNSVYNTVSSNSASWSGSTGGGSVTSPSGTILVMNGNEIEGTNSAVLTANGGEGFETVIYPQDTHIGPQMTRLAGGSVPGTGATLMIPLEQTAYSNYQVILSGTGENGWASASGTIPMGTLTASVPLEGITGEIFASANQWFNLSNGGLLTARKDGGITVTGVGELAWKSAVDNVTNTVSANSASWGGGATGDYVENSALDSATVRSSTGSNLPQVTGISSISGKPLIPKLLPQPTMQYGGQSTFAYMPDTSIWTTADAATGVFSPLQYATGACLAMDAGPFKAYYKGNEWFVSNTSYGMLRGEIHASRGIRVVGSAKDSASGFQLHPSGVNGVDMSGHAWQYGYAEYNQLTSVHDTVSANSASWGGGGVDSATVSSIASSYAESAASSKLDTSAQVVTSTASGYDMDGYAWTTEINGLEISAAKAYSASYANTAETAYSADFASSSDKATYDTDGRFLSSFTDSATVSAIASSYAESAVSGKMDSSAIDYTRTGGGTQIYVSGTGSSTNQFSAKNDSAGAAIIAGTYARVRLWDSVATGNIYASSISTWDNKMDGSAVQTAYASASASQATANGVLYILIPDGA